MTGGPPGMRTELDLIDHALRGPLNVALLNLELLAPVARGAAGGDQAVRKIREEILRLSHDLLPAAFAVLSLEITSLKPLDLHATIEHALEERRPGPVAVAPGPWPEATGDERLLALAVVQLARNAVAATPPGGRPPEIRAEPRADGGVDLVVRDWGSGLGRARASRLYPSRSGHLGGLATAVRVARLHGGALAFGPESDGAVARLSLPPASA